MRELLKYLSENNFNYLIDDDVDKRVYRVTISKDGRRISRNYTYGIENVVSPSDLIEDIESEFKGNNPSGIS